jgi:uncharacterized repeat protein (TIGR01451 family)
MLEGSAMSRLHPHFELLLAILVIGALTLTPAAAGVNSWTLAGPSGGMATAVAVHPADPDVLLAGLGNGIYRSSDGGTTWQNVGGAIGASEIIFDPANSSRVFSFSSARLAIYRSDDAGRTFAVTSGPPGVTPHRVAMGSDSTMYLVDQQGGLHRSGNLGVTWTTLPHPWLAADFTVGAIAVDPASPAVIYVGVAGSGTYRSGDGGQNWTGPMTPGAGVQIQVHDIVVKPGDPNRILVATAQALFVTSNGGVTWTPMLNGPCQAVAFDPVTPSNVVAVGFDGQVERSIDSGDTWPLALRGPLAHVMLAPALATGPAGRVVMATSDGPMVSGDGGGSFARNYSGIRADSVRSFATANDGTIYAAFYQGVFGIFQTMGGPFEPVDNIELGSRFGGYAGITHVAVAPGNRTRLYAVGSSSQLLSSFDSGQSWSGAHPQFSNNNTSINRVVVDPVNSQIAYVMTESSGVWKTENDGATWVQRSASLPVRVNAFAVDPAQPQTLYVAGWFSSDDRVFKSTDGGLTWAPTATQPGDVSLELVIDRRDPQVIYALQRFGIYKSSNGGASWAPLTFGEPVNGMLSRTLIIDPELSTTLYAAWTPEGQGFQRSVDGGATWQRVPWTPVHPSTGVGEIFAYDRSFGQIFAGGIGTGIHAYQIATDLGLSVSASPIALGAAGRFVIPVTNHGPFDAASPELQLWIPDNLAITIPGNCSTPGPNIRCRLPNIRTGTTYEFALDYVAANTASNSSLSATLVGREYDPAPANNAQAQAISVTSISDLQVSSTVTTSAQTGSAVTFTATVRNNGPNTSATTTYSLTAPAGMTLSSVTSSTGSCTAVATVYTCELGALVNGASASVTALATASSAGNASWQSAIATVSTDPTTANNLATSATVVTVPPPPAPAPAPAKSGGGGRFDSLWLGVLGVIAVWQRRRILVAAR